MARQIPLNARQRGELALRLLLKEATAGELAREASVSEPTLYQWRDAFLRGGFANMGGGGEDGEKRRHQRELAQRDQAIGELTVAVNVLKKTLGVSG